MTKLVLPRLTFLNFLWLLAWGGMFTGEYNITERMFSNPLALFQGMRALFPILAVYICVMWMLAAKISFPAFSTPLGLLFYYGAVGFFVSMLSPEKMTAIYWALAFLSPLLIHGIALNLEDPLEQLKKIIYINYGVAAFIGLIILPEVLQYGLLGGSRSQFYNLPFGLGEMRANGVGRFALLITIIAVVRLIYTRSFKRYTWMFLLLPGLYILAKTQSRTSLLGFAVASMLLVLIMRVRWQFVIIGPITAYVLWISGYRWRARETISGLISLTGREFTWQQALEQIKRSPFLGWGFHSDRILLESQHIHNSYIHALIHSGIVGLLFFASAFLFIWYRIIKSDLLRKVREVEGHEQMILIESILLLGFFTSRTFFESTAAFYGVDLLFLLPAVVYIFYWTKAQPED